MTAHPIPDNADLLDLVTLNKRWEIEDACALRKQLRLTKRSASALKGAETKREKEREGRRANLGVSA